MSSSREPKFDMKYSDHAAKGIEKGITNSEHFDGYVGG